MRRFLILVTLGLFLLPASVALASVTVERGPINIRSGPGTDQPIVGSAEVGAVFEEIEKVGDWFKIRLDDGTEAYLYAPLVRQEKSVAPNTYVITKGVMNLRSGAGTDKSIVGQAAAGSMYPVESMIGDWAKITVDEKPAYIAAWLCEVKTLGTEEFQSGDLERKVIALTQVGIRRGASENFEVVATLKSGSQVDYLGSSDGWHRVQTSAGVIGWVYGNDVRVINVDPGQGITYEIGDDYWEMRVNSTGKVTSTVNIRQGGSTSTAIVGKLSPGQSFTILETKNEWHRIEVGKTSGWVAGFLVTVDTPQGPSKVRLEKGATAKTLTISGQFPQANIAKLDDLNIGVIAAPKAGTRGHLDIYAGEIETLQFGQAGVLVSFLERPFYRTLEDQPGLLKIQFASAVESVAYLDETGASIGLNLLGHPSIRTDFDAQRGVLTVGFLGASLSSIPEIPQTDSVVSVKAAEAADRTNVVIELSPKSQYNLRRLPNRLVVDVLSPGLAGKKILIDPGHGGSDPGAIGAGGLYEKQPNLEISMKLKALLEQRGATVIMTRTEDNQGPSLADRVDLTIESDADIFVSIHNNANTDRSKAGTSVYYAQSSLNMDRSRALGRALQDSLLSALGRYDMGLRTSELYVCRNAPVAAVVAEIVFISNLEEEALLRDSAFLDRAAQAVYTGLCRYFGE